MLLDAGFAEQHLEQWTLVTCEIPEQELRVKIYLKENCDHDAAAAYPPLPKCLFVSSKHINELAFPISLDGRYSIDYYGSSVTIGLSPLRQSYDTFQFVTEPLGSYFVTLTASLYRGCDFKVFPRRSALRFIITEWVSSVFPFSHFFQSCRVTMGCEACIHFSAAPKDDIVSCLIDVCSQTAR